MSSFPRFHPDISRCEESGFHREKEGLRVGGDSVHRVSPYADIYHPFGIPDKLTPKPLNF